MNCLYLYLSIWLICITININIGFKFGGKTVISRRSINNKRSIQATTSSSPYLDALKSASLSISNNKRFFFPGHKGGSYISNKFREVLQVGETVLNLDLPELDELDNLHRPEVCSTSNIDYLNFDS
jgi:hypothetical protein